MPASAAGAADTTVIAPAAIPNTIDSIVEIFFMSEVFDLSYIIPPEYIALILYLFLGSQISKGTNLGDCKYHLSIIVLLCNWIVHALV